MKTLNLDEAAAFLHVHKEELRVRAKCGVIPGARVGRRWIFLEHDLISYVRSLYPVQRQALQSDIEKGADTCHFASLKATSGGLISTRRMEREYAEALGLEAGRRRRNTMTD